MSSRLSAKPRHRGRCGGAVEFPLAVAKGCCAAAGSQQGRGVEKGVSAAESTLLEGNLGAEPRFLGDGDLDESAETALEGGLQREDCPGGPGG